MKCDECGKVKPMEELRETIDYEGNVIERLCDECINKIPTDFGLLFRKRMFVIKQYLTFKPYTLTFWNGFFGVISFICFVLIMIVVVKFIFFS